MVNVGTYGDVIIDANACQPSAKVRYIGSADKIDVVQNSCGIREGLWYNGKSVSEK
jgi:hypothetical protein